MQKDVELEHNNLQNIFLQSPVSTSIVTGPNFILVHANEKSLEILGRKYEDVINKPVLESFPELKEQGFEQVLNNVYTTGIPFIINDNRVQLMRNGKLETMYVDIVYEPLRDTLGNITGIISTAIDLTKYTEARKKIEASEAQFKSLVNDADVATAIYTGENNTIQLANEAMLKLWGKDATVIGKTFDEQFVDVQWKHFHELLSQTKITGHLTHKSKEVEIILLEYGQIKSFYFNLTFKPLKNEEGNIYGILNMAIDVTEQVVAKQKILESEQRLLLANDAAEMGTFDWDLTNQKFLQSQRLTQIFGFPDNINITHQDLLDAFHPDDKPIRDKAVKNSLVAGSLTYEARVIWKDKSIHWIKCYGKVIYSNENEPLRMYGIIMDITAQKNSLIALEESENKLNIAIDATELGTFDINMQQEEISYSSKYLEIYGFTPSDNPTREEILNTIHPDDLQGRSTAMEQAIKTGILDHETRVIHPDNSIHWIKVRGQLVHDKNHQPERILGTVIDITKDKNATKQLQENEERLNLALASAELGPWELNLKTNASILSKKYLSILGFSEEANPTNEEIKQKVHPHYHELIIEYTNYAITTSGLLDYELKIIPFDNTLKWIKVTGKVLYNENGIAEKMLGTIMDITEQKTSFQILEQSEERFKTIANTAPVMIWMSGNDKFSDFFNSSWLIFTGHTQEEEANEGWLKSLNPKDVERCKKMYDSAFIANEGFYIEYRLKRYDGIYRWVSDNAKPRYNTDGVFIGFIGACMDIDDKKNFTEKLQQRELLFKTISNASPVGLWMTDKEAQCTFVNDTWIEWTGIPFEKQLGTGWLDKVIEEDKKKSPEKFWDSFQKREKFTSQFRIIRVDGEVRWCLTEGFPYYDINREFSGYAGSVTDITDRILIEIDLEEKVQKRTAELKRSEELNFRMINEVEDHAILLLNKYGIIENWNKGAEKIKGYNREEIIGKHFNIFYTLQDQKNGLPEKLIDEAVEFGRSSDEGWRVKKDGTTFWANVFLTALQDDNNKVVGFSKVTRDLTERKAAEQQLEEKSLDLEKANLALEKSNKELEEFAYVASHDLQEPLRKIQFFVEKVQTVIPEAESAKVYFDKIKNSTVRMNSLIKDLLDFSKLSQTNQKYTSVNLNVVLNNIIGDVELLVQQKQASIVVEDLPTIEAVPLQMQQLFYNLVCNALKFSQENISPIITIQCNKLSTEEMKKSYPSLHQNLGYYCITITDNGIGFEQKYAEKIFVIFQRLNDFYTYGGTGIGLALCKKIVLNHIGEIFAESKENQGSCFYIILPQNQTIHIV